MARTQPGRHAPEGFGAYGRLAGKLGETCEENGDCIRPIIVDSESVEARRPHAHVPGVSNLDGSPWLPLE